MKERRTSQFIWARSALCLQQSLRGTRQRLTIQGLLCRWIYNYVFRAQDLPMIISGTLLALYIVYLAVLFFQSTSANKRRGSTSRSTRTVNPKLGFLGLFGFAGFLGFWTYRVDQTIFPFVFFVFFGFFGFFYEGKMSNTLIDERYKENKMRAQSTANKTALSIIFLQY